MLYFCSALNQGSTSLPCGDVKGNSIGGEINTNFMFFAGFVGVPSEERSAGLFVELVFLI